MHLRPFQRGDERALHDIFYSAIHYLAIQHYTQAQCDAWAPVTYDVSRWEARMQALKPFVVERDKALIAYADVQDDGLICVFHTIVTGYFTEFAGHDQFIFASNFELNVTGKVV